MPWCAFIGPHLINVYSKEIWVSIKNCFCNIPEGNVRIIQNHWKFLFSQKLKGGNLYSCTCVEVTGRKSMFQDDIIPHTSNGIRPYLKESIHRPVVCQRRGDSFISNFSRLLRPQESKIRSVLTLHTRRTQTPGTRSPGRLNSVRWRLQVWVLSMVFASWYLSGA